MADRLARVLASDQVMRIMGAFTAALVLVMLVLAGLTVPQIASNTQASRRTDDLASCRAQHRAAIDSANYQVDSTSGQVQDAQGQAIVAAIRQDPTTLALIAAEIETAIEARREAEAGLFTAIEDYEAAAALSRTDPERFLFDCKG